ncbi:hypothetical protein N7509_000211 [Penicillium cosmopolitanum]|uniref:Uncharacterized protein n=1 Tax=Penicillium cosmopolitanum TaxID=1131564 RepID=A0A9W9WCN1_9EURO|nr:uncharacterized protein N7509_000211 [Penicillium cosmopolitanum]KAJ5414877.1 hypothetical protein N7509_000211 [Penicillium cosmopolitanum]
MDMITPEDRSSSSFQANLHYLKRLDLYRREKPFMITFDVSGFKDGTKTNHEYGEYTALMTDARGEKGRFLLDTHGFEFRNWPTALSPVDFDDDGAILDYYVPEVMKEMRDAFPQAMEIHFLTHLRRKRCEDFPNTFQEEPAFANPVLYAHTDFTPDGAARQLESLFKDSEHLRGKRFEMLK